MIALWVWFVVGIRWYHIFRRKFPGEKIDMATVWFGALAVSLYGGYLMFLWARMLLPERVFTDSVCEKLGTVGACWLLFSLWTIWQYYWIKHYRLNKALEVVPLFFSWLW